MNTDSIKNKSSGHQPISLIRQHRFEDTFALFIVFLSFNHFTSLCMLMIFIVTTRTRRVIANSFITLCLFKRPSPSIDDITHRDSYPNQQEASFASPKYLNLSKSHPHHSHHHSQVQGKKIARVPTANTVNGNNFSSNLNSAYQLNHQNSIPNMRLKQQDRKHYRSHHSKLSPMSVLIEILVATLARMYAGNYFIIPIENLAVSIIASSLINDPNECLSFATSCSVLYAISVNILKRFYILLALSKTNSISGFIFFYLNSNSNIHINYIKKFIEVVTRQFDYLPNWEFLNIKYIRIIRYYLSFYIVVNQFSRKAFIIHTSHDFPSLAMHLDVNKGILKNNQNMANFGVDSSPNLNVQNSVDSVSIYQQSHSSNQISSNNNNNSNIQSTHSLNSKGLSPYFSKIVKSIKSFEPAVITRSDNELQSPNTTILASAGSNMKRSMDNVDNIQNFTNQLYELNVDLDSPVNVINNLKDDINITTNLENFIHYLFKKNAQYIISPLWAIFVTWRTTNFEKKILRDTNFVTNDKDNSNSQLRSIKNEGSATHDSVDINSRNSINKKSSDPINKSVFNISDSNSMALIAQNKFDDYDQLNLIKFNNNIFNNKENEYKVCIIDIGTHSLTFHIENLTDGELIVLVNGIIWSEVSCALILEHSGEEYVVVSGLVPSCSYDIQFVNRLRHKDDYLICDLIVRTMSLKANKYEVANSLGSSSNQFEKLDFSFPSYYHRKFLSPLLTLKHSILTTNANLTEEKTKLKKTKKEVNKKLASLRQEIDYLKSKIKQNETNDEKNAFKIENLKTTIQQNESTLKSLEDQIKILDNEEINLEEIYIKKKDAHLKKELEFSKVEEEYKKENIMLINKENKLKNDYKQLLSKKEKLDLKHDQLQKEVTQNNELYEKYKIEFVSKKEKERVKRTENRFRETSNLELSVKALEQDINRLENENSTLSNIVKYYK
ncbi:hypothetical protein RI543_001515 [Arxiozyma heterogenica]|uniref:Uncharacterized protein n=1 Tax=Arxiozyma heterogenica TaxID=278026 RepID=A0AAN7WTP3_9SACH|nr:hypothetical protein RI543_001515 [Kazachstania heterogenica]